MKISYVLTSFGAYKLHLETRFDVYASENIAGFTSDAKDEIGIISTWSLVDVMRLHNWTKL